MIRFEKSLCFSEINMGRVSPFIRQTLCLQIMKYRLFISPDIQYIISNNSEEQEKSLCDKSGSL